MAWHKASAEAGLAGLEPWEAARGVMLVPEFQNMPDPLDPPKGSFLLVSVYSNIILHVHSTVYNVEGVEAIYLKFVFNFNMSTCTVQCMMSKVSKQVQDGW